MEVNMRTGHGVKEMSRVKDRQQDREREREGVGVVINKMIDRHGREETRKGTNIEKTDAVMPNTHSSLLQPHKLNAITNTSQTVIRTAKRKL